MKRRKLMMKKKKIHWSKLPKIVMKRPRKLLRTLSRFTMPNRV